MLGQIAIRTPELDDAERVGRAHSVAADEAYGSYFPRDWMFQRNTPAKRTEQWHQLLSEPAPEGQLRRVRIAEAGEKVLGFGIFGTARDADAPVGFELHRLYVLSEAYGSGLSDRLLHELTPERPAHYLWVMEQNRRAIAYYRKRGYWHDGAVERLPTIANLPKTRMVWSPQ
ncbi:GNAT family N-acetyltransferase [Nesterenkonia natronophila]|uniref:GNAT family N-acetyltransferase n=1 Tax=Nesterenkonia natronophila TaxID=2174932 RepID=UPI001314BB75|nr:GNAT family N-acetyltransferase [Nesterenkonia natronophila]